MKYKTKTTATKNNVSVLTHSDAHHATTADETSPLSKDFITSLLIVSLIINVFIFITWLTLQTTVYDYQLANFIFNR